MKSSASSENDLPQKKPLLPLQTIPLPQPHQAFQGAIAGVGAQKGVFITTSTYTQQAIAYASQLRDSKIILIDSQKLTQLMVEHDVGVSIKETLHIKRIDKDFFTDTEF